LRFKTETMVGIFIFAAVGVFLYMSYQVGYFRFDRLKYNTYSVYFNDISGLSKKSDVKIAGVKVGWVDSVDLINDGQQVKATLMLDKKYTLFSDAHAVVRQEGLLGSKYLELNPGDPLLPVLPSGSMLTRPSSGPVVVDELMRQFKGIAANIESVTDSMRGAMGGAAGEEKLKLLITDLQQAAQKFASFAGAVDRIAVRNEGNIDDIMSDLRTVMQDLKNEIPRLSQNLQQNFERISATLDRDFARVANQFEKVTSPIQDVASKINEGRGILGQFVNDDDAYQDLRVAVSGIKKYFDKMDKIAVIVDVHLCTVRSRNIASKIVGVILIYEYIHQRTPSGSLVW
jgi:phospholipid/cholesterol/gamma-HCH transport system substrate-binding protein